MPAEFFSPIRQVWMLWPERRITGATAQRPAQAAYARVAAAVARFAEVTVVYPARSMRNCRAKLPPCVRVVEISSNDAWVRDCGPTFLKKTPPVRRAVDWEFNAWAASVRRRLFPLG